MTCGCKIKVIVNADAKDQIDFCPLHAAAQEMADALKLYGHEKCSCPACEAARAALALAKAGVSDV